MAKPPESLPPPPPPGAAHVTPAGVRIPADPVTPGPDITVEPPHDGETPREVGVEGVAEPASPH